MLGQFHFQLIRQFLLKLLDIFVALSVRVNLNEVEKLCVHLVIYFILLLNLIQYINILSKLLLVIIVLGNYLRQRRSGKGERDYTKQH